MGTRRRTRDYLRRWCRDDDASSQILLMPSEMVTESQSEISIYATGYCSDFMQGDRGGCCPGSWMFTDQEGTNDLARRYLTLGQSKNAGVIASHLGGRRAVGCSVP